MQPCFDRIFSGHTVDNDKGGVESFSQGYKLLPIQAT